MPQPSNRFRCPKCGRDYSLWRGVEVPGWQSIDTWLEPHSRSCGLDRDVYWEQADLDGNYGCAECGWVGRKDGLIELGNDGQPLTKVHPEQEVLC